jgi:hypothetical protein
MKIIAFWDGTQVWFYTKLPITEIGDNPTEN